MKLYTNDMDTYKIRHPELSDAEAIAKVHVQSWQETYRQIVPDSYLDTISVDERRAGWYRLIKHPEPKSHILVLENENDEIIGFSCGGSGRQLPHGTGEIYAIYLLRAYQKKSLGQKLLNLSLTYLDHEGFEQAALWVFTDNNAAGFYKKMNAKPQETKTENFAGVALEETLFQWDSLKKNSHGPMFHLTTKQISADLQDVTNYVPKGYEKEGFIHGSFACQLESIWNMLGQDPILAAFELKFSQSEKDLIFEAKNADKEFYPHIYRPLQKGDIVNIHNDMSRLIESYDQG